MTPRAQAESQDVEAARRMIDGAFMLHDIPHTRQKAIEMVAGLLSELARSREALEPLVQCYNDNVKFYADKGVAVPSTLPVLTVRLRAAAILAQTTPQETNDE
jgi:hypothetical protein